MEVMKLATFSKYKSKNGANLWRFNAHLGVDPMTGKQKRTTRRGFKTKKAAPLALDRLKIDIQEHGFNHTQSVPKTYEDVYHIWVESYVKTVKPSTFLTDQRIYKYHIIPVFGKLRIEKINAAFCQKVINRWFDKFKNYRKMWAYVGVIFNYAERLGMISGNPAKLVTMPRVKGHLQQDKPFFDRIELEQFFKCLNVEYGPNGKTTNNPQVLIVFRLLAFLGIRKGELLALQWPDIDFNKATITINKTASRGADNHLIISTPKTKNSNRVLEVDHETLKQLKYWQLTQRKAMLKLGYNTSKPKQLVVSSVTNGILTPSAPRRWLKNTTSKHNLKEVNIHSFRHAHASLLIAAGADPKEVSARLGHSDSRTTLDVYVGTTQEAKKETAEKFARYVNF